MAEAQSDEELASLTKQGHKQAFNELVNRYEAKILRYGRRFLFSYEDVRDAVQEVFIKAYVNIASFNTSRSFSTWLYRIAHNSFINVIKKKKREPLSFFDFDTFVQFAVASPNSIEEDIFAKEDQASIQAALQALSPKYREPMILYYGEQRSYEEIGDIMHIPIATVGVRLKRAREQLQKILNNQSVKPTV